MSLLSAPTWLLVALLLLLVIVLVGPERTYQRAVGLLQAFRGTGPDAQEPLAGPDQAAKRDGDANGGKAA